MVLAAGPALGEDVDQAERVEVPDEVQRRDGDDHRPQLGQRDVPEPLPRARAVDRRGLVQLVPSMFCSPASRAMVVCGMPAQTPTTITAGRAVLKLPSQLMSLVDSPTSLQDAVDRAGVGS